MKNLTYTQWFALLVLKHFSPERSNSAVRANTLRSLVRRGLATEGDGKFSITPRGVAVENFIERAPLERPRATRRKGEPQRRDRLKRSTHCAAHP